MRTTLSRLAGTALTGAALALAVPASAAAAAPSAPGYDVSHPQCDVALPSSAVFAAVGVNGGLASTPNQCLTRELAWAAAVTASATVPGTVPAHPPVQLYLNTANPGELRRQVATWPSSGHTPYGDCAGGNDTSCSWEYGWERARASVGDFFVPAATAAGMSNDPAAYTWWLDVETMNTWQGGSPEAIARNRAALEGMAGFLLHRGAHVGLYSTGEQWDGIVGAIGWDSDLYRLPSWLAGANDADEALAACSDDPLVAGGVVAMTQYVTTDLDTDLACG